jgi:hypothetical protein
MDLESAKELDYVLSFFKDGKEHHSVVIKDAEKLNKRLKHDYNIHLKYLSYIGLLKRNLDNEWKFQIEFEGLVFEGFENKFKKDNRLISKELLYMLFSGVIGAVLATLLQILVQKCSIDKVQKIEINKPIEIMKTDIPKKKETYKYNKSMHQKDTLIVKTILIKTSRI